MNLLLIDSSYTSFYRFFATVRWFSFAKADEWKEIKDKPNYDWLNNETFIKTYSKMYLESIKKLVGAKIWKDSYIIFCQDDHRHTLWRNELNKEYKEGRQDLSLKHNFKPIFEYTYSTLIPNFVKEHTNIISIKVATVEADDIIAVISQITKDTEHQIYLISGDDDFTQLGRTNLTIMNYKSKNQKKLTEEESKKLLLNKIINGDKSDNIPSIFKNNKVTSKIKKELCSCQNKLEEFLDANEHIKEQFKLNQKMIDFNYMPKNIRKKIIKVVNKKLII
jgi:5'-3' exonuclease